jgi:hypothetical protein
MPSLQSLNLPELSPTVLEALRCQGVTTLEHFLTRVDPLDIPDEAGCGTSNSKVCAIGLPNIDSHIIFGFLLLSRSR